MAKFVVWHERTQRIMTTIEADTRGEALDKYDEYVDNDFDKVDRRFDRAYSMYDTYCEEYCLKERLQQLARSENVFEILTLEEAIEE